MQFAPADGTVVAIQEGMDNTFASGVANWGNFVKIDHGGNVFTLSGHLLKGSINTLGIKVGSKVVRGQPIGRMNNSGYSNGSHNHFEVYLGGSGTANRVDPMLYCYVYPDQNVRPTSALLDRFKYLKDVAPTEPVGAPVQRDTTQLQAEICVTDVRGRSNPNLMDNIQGFMREGYYNIEDTRDMTHEASNGHIWYLSQGLWFAHVVGVLLHQPIIETLPSEDEYKAIVMQIQDIIKKVL
jgi:hypothetical protein